MASFPFLFMKLTTPDGQTVAEPVGAEARRIARYNYLAARICQGFLTTFHTFHKHRFAGVPMSITSGADFNGQMLIKMAPCPFVQTKDGGYYDMEAWDYKLDSALSAYFSDIAKVAKFNGDVVIDRHQNMPAYIIQSENPQALIDLLEGTMEALGIKSLEGVSAHQQAKPNLSNSFFTSVVARKSFEMGQAGLSVRQIEERALASMPLRPYADPHAAYAHGLWSWENQKSVNISLGQLRVLARELMDMAVLPEDVGYRIQ